MTAPRIPRIVPRGRRKPNVRRHGDHLAYIRQLPCIACGLKGSTEAAHVRSGADGGVGLKPHDRHSMPLCSACHRKQHRVGELTFWSSLRIDPLDAASRLWTVSGDLEAGERIVFRTRQRIALQGFEDIWLGLRYSERY